MNKKARWMLQTKRADFEKLAEQFQVDPVTARIIRNRDVVGEDQIRRYLYGATEDLYSPHLLKDLDLAVGILTEKIRQGKAIRIVGDYDIDGVCSTYLLYRGFQRCGALVDYQIPERIRDGYGINEAIIQKAGEDQVDTLVTCDNGISAKEQIRLAKDAGMTVIITDHHEVPVRDGQEDLPGADAIINPKQRACDYPFDGICGGVVAYKLVQALYEAFDIPAKEWEEMLEFAAIATVGDVMKLQDENRILVKWGLRQFAKTRSLGLRKLVDACGLDIHNLSAYHIGFVIGPCLNASGRLKTAQLALELLLCQDPQQAEDMAAQIRLLNEERKTMTQKGVEEALVQVEQRYREDTVLVVYLPDCHESLAGIIAGRLRETYQKPSFVLTRSEGCVKGSGRSIPAYSMYQALCGVEHLLLKFGGHPMAAGFSLQEENVEEFRSQLNSQSSLTAEDLRSEIWIDVAMPLEYLSEDLVSQLHLLEPFGQGNEKPQFAQKNLNIRSLRVLGKNRNAVKLSLATKEGLVMDGMLFTEGDRFVQELGDRREIDVVYYPDINEFGGNRTLQIIIRDYQLPG